jgi:hypothetical protein
MPMQGLPPAPTTLPELLGAVANNPKEQRARQRVLAQHPNKFAGYAAFAKAYVQALRVVNRSTPLRQSLLSLS